MWSMVKQGHVDNMLTYPMLFYKNSSQLLYSKSKSEVDGVTQALFDFSIPVNNVSFGLK